MDGCKVVVTLNVTKCSILFPSPGVNHDELVRIAEKQFTNFPCTSTSLPTLTPCRFTGSEMRVRDDSMPYAHIAMAVEVRITGQLCIP